mgnify:CR=1 FL=1
MLESIKLAPLSQCWNSLVSSMLLFGNFSARSCPHAFDADGYGVAGHICKRYFVSSSAILVTMKAPSTFMPGEPSRVELWLAYPRNSRPPWRFMLPTRQSMRGPVLPLGAGPGMLALPVAPVPALTDDMEPLPRRRRVLPATFV